jgi:hypothetical protein
VTSPDELFLADGGAWIPGKASLKTRGSDIEPRRNRMHFLHMSTTSTPMAEQSVLVSFRSRLESLKTSPSWLRQALCAHEWREVGYSGPDWLVYECIKCDKAKLVRT